MIFRHGDLLLLVAILDTAVGMNDGPRASRRPALGVNGNRILGDVRVSHLDMNRQSRDISA